MARLARYDPGRVLTPVGMAAALLVGVSVSLVPTPVALTLIAALAWTLALYRSFRLLALITLVIAVAVPRYATNMLGLTVNLERVMIPAVAAATVLYLLLGRRRFSPPSWRDASLVVYVTVLLLASILNPTDDYSTIRLTVLVGIAVLPFWLVPILARNDLDIRRAYVMFICVAVAEAALGLVALAAYSTLGVDLGLQRDPLTGALSPFGSQWEGNTYGSFLGAALVALVGWLSISAPRKPIAALGAVASVLIAVALMTSLARGAWIGAGVGLLAVAIYALRDSMSRIVVAAVTTMTGGVCLYVFNEELWRSATQRALLLGGALQGQLDGTVLERVYVYSIALESWADRFLIGWGAGSFGERFTFLSQAIPGWIGNLEIHALHDSGVLGLAALTFAMAATLVAVFTRLDSIESEAKGVALGILGAGISLLTSYQATEATWLGYTWFLFGLASAIVKTHPAKVE